MLTKEIQKYFERYIILKEQGYLHIYRNVSCEFIIEHFSSKYIMYCLANHLTDKITNRRYLIIDRKQYCCYYTYASTNCPVKINNNYVSYERFRKNISLLVFNATKELIEDNEIPLSKKYYRLNNMFTSIWQKSNDGIKRMTKKEFVKLWNSHCIKNKL
jgi:hypothetical protein